MALTKNSNDKSVSVSVVIPVYNEQLLIGRCLTALFSQTTLPEEVIVVDNNSTDRTAEICRKFPVRLLSEKEQGLIPTRNTGFNAANGDIIARIDADTMVGPNWTAEIKRAFDDDKKLVGIAGVLAIAELSPPGRYWFIPATKALRAIQLNTLGLDVVLWGYNHAIRRSAWEQIRSDKSLADQSLSEDINTSIVLSKVGKLAYVDQMVVKCFCYRFISIKKWIAYRKQDKRTLALYKK